MSPPRHPPLGLGAAEAHDQHDLDHALPASGPGNGCPNRGPGSSAGSGPGDAGERVGFLVLAGELSGAGASWTRWRLGPADVRPGTGAGLEELGWVPASPASGPRTCGQVGGHRCGDRGPMRSR